jgi:hypothetical protein
MPKPTLGYSTPLWSRTVLAIVWRDPTATRLAMVVVVLLLLLLLLLLVAVTAVAPAKAVFCLLLLDSMFNCGERSKRK